MYLSGSTEVRIIGHFNDYFDIQLAGLMQELLSNDIVLLLSLLRELPADRRICFWGLSTYVTSFKKVMEKLLVFGVTELDPNTPMNWANLRGYLELEVHWLVNHLVGIFSEAL